MTTKLNELSTQIDCTEVIEFKVIGFTYVFKLVSYTINKLCKSFTDAVK